MFSKCSLSFQYVLILFSKRSQWVPKDVLILFGP
jgi:hypothetical protein